MLKLFRLVRPFRGPLMAVLALALAQSLANLYDTSVEYRYKPNVTFTGYYGYAQGLAVTRAIYPKGKNGAFGYLEVNYRF